MAAETSPPSAPDPDDKLDERSSSLPLWLLVLAVLALAAASGIILYWGHVGQPWWEGDSDKKFWDYLELLIVPAALALGVYWLNRVQSERDRKAEQAQQQSALEVENQRAQSEALQSYLDAMDALLRDVSLTEDSGQSSLINRELAQARTITVIASLGAARNKIVTRFLRNLNLTRPGVGILREADLAAADLAESFLAEADLSGGDLRRAVLWGADLRGAKLSLADLRYANLGEAHLGQADLDHANLIRANMGNTFLRGAYLGGAYLSEANLNGADLTDAVGITNEELDQQASSLKAATMPNGQTYEEWLKRKGRGEDGEKSNPS